jgi:Icc-related predicted phosphoesterase
MRLLVLSDLHLEFGHQLTVPEDIKYDVVILAGDIDAPGSRAIAWAQQPETFGGRPVVFVPGNHEYYRTEYHDALATMQVLAAGSNVHLLSPGSAVIGGVRFIGCTLWTDFELPLRRRHVGTLEQRGRAMAAAKMAMADYARIRIAAPGGLRRALTPADTLAMHQSERAWLLAQLQKQLDSTTVVVTHHAPSDGSVAPMYADDWCTPAFVSHLPDEFFEVPVLWVHGHTHSHFDYRRGNCRVVSDPRGYRMRDSSYENSQFAARFVVEI